MNSIHEGHLNSVTLIGVKGSVFRDLVKSVA